MDNQIKPNDIVKHKKDKYLIRGTVRKISKSGLRAIVDWEKEDNPRLFWMVSAYYRLDLLEVIKEGDRDGQPKG